MINRVGNYVERICAQGVKRIDVNNLKFLKANSYSDVIREGHDVGYVIKKTINPDGTVKKEPYQVSIKKREHLGSYIYEFFDKAKSIGGIRFTEWTNILPQNKYYPSLKDYPDLGIVGDRIFIDMVDSFEPSRFSGIAKLADKVVLEHCIRKNIPLNVVFCAAYNSHALHYLRGARFMPGQGCGDLNRLVSEYIKNTPKGEKYNTCDLGNIMAYLPVNKIKEYVSEIFKSPSLRP